MNHQCKVCRSVLPCDMVAVAAHAAEAHEMTYAGYLGYWPPIRPLGNNSRSGRTWDVVTSR